MEQYLILDCDQSSLTTGTMRTPANAEIIELEIPDGDSELLEGEQQLQFIGYSPNTPSFLGEIVRIRSSRVSVRYLQRLGEVSEETLQVEHHFDSFVYPISGDWKGRYPISVSRLGCGGISFTSDYVLKSREMIEVVIPVKDGEALLLCGKIVYPTSADAPSNTLPYQYKLKFISGVEDMEVLVRKEVMYRQIKHRDHPKLIEKKNKKYKEPHHPSH